MSINCLDFAELTVSTSAVGLEDASPTLTEVMALSARALGCIITVEDAAVRYRTDGTDPSSSVGHELADTDVLTFDSWTSGLNWRSVLKKLKFIRISGDAKLMISYYG